MKALDPKSVFEVSIELFQKPEYITEQVLEVQIVRDKDLQETKGTNTPGLFNFLFSGNDIDRLSILTKSLKKNVSVNKNQFNIDVSRFNLKFSFIGNFLQTLRSN